LNTFENKKLLFFVADVVSMMMTLPSRDLDCSPVRERRGTIGRLSKVDYVCIEEDIVECVCADLFHQIQQSRDDNYIPNKEYSVFTKPSAQNCEEV
jgi:hypothetical protein